MNLANVSLYGFEDYHVVDIGVVRCVRLWFAPLGGEVAVEIKIKDGDSKLGFAITRTQEISFHPKLPRSMLHETSKVEFYPFPCKGYRLCFTKKNNNMDNKAEAVLICWEEKIQYVKIKSDVIAKSDECMIFLNLVNKHKHLKIGGV
ncbi:hypothetical protein LXL04_009033 [Taraxacum kok-saghyz]